MTSSPPPKVTPLATAFHSPPRFDLFGNQLASGTSPRPDVNVKMPLGWSLESSRKTQTSLLEDRRLEKIPHSSYDLDNDGKVGGQDLVIAKLFDQDKDGKLNEGERKQAERALSQGVLDSFVWGIEQSGPTRAYRILQKRGVIVDQEDFGGLRDTYPRRDLLSPKFATFTQLRTQRAEQRLLNLQKQKETWDLLHPYTVKVEEKEYSKTSTFPYRSLSEKFDLDAKRGRVKAGLSPEPTVLSTRDIPTTAYLPNPAHHSKSHLDSERKAELLSELYAKKNFDHVNSDQRLLERESKLVAIVPEGQKGATYSDFKEQLRKETNEANVQKFSNVVIGIHGQELPKFAEENQDYWKSRAGYNANPAVSSQIELRQQRKFWAPRDMYKVTDKDEAMPPPDPFKSTHLKPERKAQKLPDKPTAHIPVPYTTRDPNTDASKPRKMKFRWTTLVHYFAKGSVFAPMKDPEIPDVDEVQVVEEKKEYGLDRAKVNTTHGSSEGPSALQGGSNYVSKKGSVLGRRLTKPLSSVMVRSSGFVESV